MLETLKAIFMCIGVIFLGLVTALSIICYIAIKPDEEEQEQEEIKFDKKV